MNKVFLGIGTNLGDRSANLNEAVSKIGDFIGKVTKTSSVYETEPWGFETEDQFYNMVIETETSLSASGVLGAILMIEATLGRLRTGEQYSSRSIDIDILFYNDLVMNEEALKIPHPHLHERKFVLVPLCDIAPGMVHPVLNKSIADLLNLCKDKSEVRKIIL
jgi:2-amino-4-hydroxy-6-hydroxymethyldihydropteridine diphosphokinase